MRIGTWNIAGRWSEDHAALLTDANCDVWLLTEVNDRTVLPGFETHRCQLEMAAKRRWAAIASRLPMTPEPDPHPASARVRIVSTTYVSSILQCRTPSTSCSASITSPCRKGRMRRLGGSSPPIKASDCLTTTCTSSRSSCSRQPMPSRRATSSPATRRTVSGSPTTTSSSVARDIPT